MWQDFLNFFTHSFNIHYLNTGTLYMNEVIIATLRVMWGFKHANKYNKIKQMFQMVFYYESWNRSLT